MTTFYGDWKVYLSGLVEVHVYRAAMNMNLALESDLKPARLLLIQGRHVYEGELLRDLDPRFLVPHSPSPPLANFTASI